MCEFTILLRLNKRVLHTYIICVVNYFKVCLLAEKQALQRLKRSLDDNINIVDSIKADLTEIFPLVKFYRIHKKFMMDFLG